MNLQKSPSDDQLALLASIVETGYDAILTKTLDGIITSWNAGAVAIYGYEADEIIGQNVSILSPPGQVNEVPEILSRLRRGETIHHYETERVRKDGAIINVSVSVSPLISRSGEIIGAATIARDVTAEYQAREESKKKLSGLLESAPDAMVIVDQAGVITMVNTQTEIIFGYDRGEILGKSIEILIPERYRDRHLGHRSGYIVDPRVRAMGTGLELYGLRRDGSEFPVEIKLSPMRLKEELLITAAVRDVTVQKQASQYTRSLIEASLDPLVTINPKGKITDVNEATIRVTGVKRDDLVGTDFSIYFTEPRKAKDGYQRAFAKGFVTDFPLTIRHREGRLTDVLYNASVYKDLAGNVLGIFAAARDVTAMKKAEQELAEQRRREQERLVELERFQKLTVGRELKMIDLKKEIEDLRLENEALKQRRGR